MPVGQPFPKKRQRQQCCLLVWNKCWRLSRRSKPPSPTAHPTPPSAWTGSMYYTHLRHCCKIHEPRECIHLESGGDHARVCSRKYRTGRKWTGTYAGDIRKKTESPSHRTQITLCLTPVPLCKKPETCDKTKLFRTCGSREGCPINQTRQTLDRDTMDGCSGPSS